MIWLINNDNNDNNDYNDYNYYNDYNENNKLINNKSPHRFVFVYI